MQEFYTTRVLVGTVPLRVEVTGNEFVEIGNLHDANNEATFFVAGALAQCTPQQGRPIPPGHTFRWQVHGSNHVFFLVAESDFDDQHAAITAR